MASPNILVLMCDQLRADAVFGEVASNAPPSGGICATPNLDRLRRRGVSFTRAYTPNPVCSPARASLMTGKLPHNHNVLWVTHTMPHDQVRIREGLPHFAQDLVRAGYETSYVGKWHVEPAERPSWYGWKRDRSMHSPEMSRTEGRSHGQLIPRVDVAGEGYRTALLAGVTSVPPEERPMGRVVGLAREELRELARDRAPWCLFVSVPEPHDPYVCGLEAFGSYADWRLEPPVNWTDDLSGRPRVYGRAARAFTSLTPQERQLAARCYYASVSEIDAQFGMLLDDLDGFGLTGNTVVVLTADHGDFLGAHGMYCKNIGAWEEAYNVPLVIAGPGIGTVGGRASRARVGTHAVFGSILKRYGLPARIDCDAPLFDDVLAGGPDDPHTDGLAEYHGGRLLLTQRVYYHGRWKLVWNGFDDHEFYDLDSDPYELINLAGERGPAVRGDGPTHEAYLDVTGRMWDAVRRSGDATLSESQYVGLRTADVGPEPE